MPTGWQAGKVPVLRCVRLRCRTWLGGGHYTCLLTCFHWFPLCEARLPLMSNMRGARTQLALWSQYGASVKVAGCSVP